MLEPSPAVLEDPATLLEASATEDGLGNNPVLEGLTIEDWVLKIAVVLTTREVRDVPRAIGADMLVGGFEDDVESRGVATITVVEDRLE